VYVLAWSWDASGESVALYPGKDTRPENTIIKLRAGNVREFMGEGAVLFPPRAIAGGLAVRINVWESDKGARDFGTKMSEVTGAIQQSKLNNLRSLLALAGPQLATLTLIKDAALELAGVVGTILQSNGDHGYCDRRATSRRKQSNVLRSRTNFRPRKHDGSAVAQ
jgi:hypothetical protein